jgi:micrococcal nuclease
MLQNHPHDFLMSPHSFVLAFLVVLLLALFSALPAFAKDPATIVRVVDGDTLEVKLNGQKEKIRLIGVDTPEKFESDKLHRDAARTDQNEKTIRALGERASDFTKSLVKRGDTVQLEYDQQLRDKYQRLLAFVWLSDGRMGMP